MGLGSSLEKLREMCSGSEEALRMIDEEERNGLRL